MGDQMISLWQILNLIDSGGKVTPDILAEKLEVTRRSVFRYVNTLLAAGFPIYFSKNENTYKFEEGFSLQKIDLSQDDLTFLILTSNYFEGGKLPFIGSPKSVLEKIKSKSSAMTERREMPICFQSPTMNLEGKEGYFSTIRKAYTNKKSIQIAYRSRWEGKETKRMVDPYGIYMIVPEAYLVGYCHLRNDIRTFALEGIQKVAITGKHYDVPKDFDFYEFCHNSWGIVRKGRRKKVKIRFSKKVARWVSMFQWHKTQASKFDDDGNLILEFFVSGDDEIIRWVMKWGAEAEVLLPKTTRMKLMEYMEQIRNKYMEDKNDKR